MKAEQFLEVMHTAEKLKDTMRHCYTSGGRRESVAEHSWRIGLMAFFMEDEFPEADMAKVINMCLIHDLGEIFTGDIPAFAKTAKDESTEEEKLLAWVETLSQPYREKLRALYKEMNELKTLEARIYKAMDSLEAVIQHNESPIDTWEPHEYELNRTYAYDRVEFSEYLQELRRTIRKETEKKIETEGKSRESGK